VSWNESFRICGKQVVFLRLKSGWHTRGGIIVIFADLCHRGYKDQNTHFVRIKEDDHSEGMHVNIYQHWQIITYNSGNKLHVQCKPTVALFLVSP
jgi:hypothetical protein